MRLRFALGFFIAMSSAGFAQTNGLAPAELPPAGFEGREYVDSRGCMFLRSTFGGSVTWVPRYGPDRQPVCNGTPSILPETQAEAAAQPGVDAPAETAQPASVPRPQSVPRARSPRQPALPQADASGRHPSCPASAPYGQLVDTTLGRPLVRCVTSPSLFLDEYFNGAGAGSGAPIALPGGAEQASHGAASKSMAHSGRVVQVGSFRVPDNATRLNARLQGAGLPARIHSSGGFRVVTVGPVRSASEVQSALAYVRRMGFDDAFVRR